MSQCWAVALYSEIYTLWANLWVQTHEFLIFLSMIVTSNLFEYDHNIDVFKHSEHMLYLIIIILRFFSADCLFETIKEACLKIKTLSLFSFFSKLSTDISSASWHQKIWTSL